MQCILENIGIIISNNVNSILTFFLNTRVKVNVVHHVNCLDMMCIVKVKAQLQNLTIT